MEFVAQIIGFFGAAIAIGSFQCKSTKKLFLVQSLSAILFSIHFFMLMGYSGVIQNLIALIRGYVFFNHDKKWARHPAVLVILISACILGGIYTYNNFFSVLPMIAMVAGTLAMWTYNGYKIRVVQFFVVSPFWLTYNISVMSYSGILTELFNLISVVVSYMRFGKNGYES